MHDSEDLVEIFNACFSKSYNTQLVRGSGEPIYIPASSGQSFHRIEFAHGFFSSALHECAHWCIAGVARRKQIDYGYWYAPDGRNKEQQNEFFRVEIKPQALELLFSLAAKYPFQLSVDNLNGEFVEPHAFKADVEKQVQLYRKEGLPRRALIFYTALCKFYR